MIKDPTAVQDTIIESIKIVTDSLISKLQFDITVEAEIVSIENLDSGEYKVKYNDGIFFAYAKNIKETYKIGDRVYLLLIQGDLSNKKIIEGKISQDSLSAQEINSLTNKVAAISSNLIPEVEEYNLNISNEKTEKLIFLNDNNNNNIFKQYKDKETIQIKAKFKINIDKHERPLRGNYGLEIGFLTNDVNDENNKILVYRMDYNTFIGDPYRYINWSEQDEIIQVPKNSIKGIEYVKFFQEGFTNIEGIIYVKDISISYVEMKNLINDTYYVNCKSIQGLNVNEGPVILEPQLIYNKENILNDNYEIFWFKKDPSITRGHENFNELAGVGWRELTGKDGSEKINNNILTVQFSAVTFINYYKFIIVHQTTTLFSDEIVVRKGYENEYIIEQKQDVDVNGKQLTKLVVNNSKEGDWYKLLPNGEYSLVNQNSNELDITEDLKYISVVYYFKSNDNIVLESTITNSFDENDIQLSFQGQDIFIYNEDGDIDIEQIETTHVLEIYPSWTPGKSSQYKISLMNDKNPINSMLKNIQFDSENKISYNIVEKYRSDYNNNIIKIKITTFNNEDYYFYKDISFIKEGNKDINQSSYQVIIKPSNIDGVKKFNFSPSPRYITAYVYKDGIPYAGNYTYEWSIVNAAFVGSGGKTREIDYTNTNNTKPTYAKVKVTVGEEEKIAFYPFDILNKGNIAYDYDFSTIPQFITYSTSGYKPSFNNITLNAKVKTSTNGQWQILKPTVQAGSLKINKNILTPSTTFQNDKNPMGVLKFSNDSVTIYRTIIMTLSTTGNEAIKGWDGTAIATNKKVGETIESGDTILKPQVGAGTYKNGIFDGIVMGTINSYGMTKNYTGLFGYNNGVPTFGFKDDGTGFIGSEESGGQILFDGNKSTIRGGGNAKQEAMILDLTKGIGDKYAIRVYGDEKDELMFSVSYFGKMTAKNANITGGKIGGWTLKDNKLQGVDNKIILDGGEEKISEGFVIEKRPASITAESFNISAIFTNGKRVTGTIGAIAGNDGITETSILGITSGDSVALEAPAIRIGNQDKSSTVYLVGNINTENTTGIYARFA